MKNINLIALLDKGDSSYLSIFEFHFDIGRSFFDNITLMW